MLSQQLQEELSKVVGEGNIIFDVNMPEVYWRDALRRHRGFLGYQRATSQPDALVKPASTREISDILSIASRERIPVVPYGGGTGLMGGATPAKGGIILNLSRMNRIVEVNTDDLWVHAQAGAILEDLSKVVEAKGLVLGHDPWSLPKATIGGSIATDGLGYYGRKYGSMGEQVLSLEAVLPDGNILRTRRAHKSSTGLNLNRLFIGTEGTFGVISEATLKLHPRPEARMFQLVEFENFETGFNAVVTLFNKQLEPTVLDYGETWSEDARSKQWVAEKPTSFIIYEGSQHRVNQCVREARDILKEFKARHLPEEEAHQQWEDRHAAIEAYSPIGEGLLLADKIFEGVKFDYVHVSLPRSKITEYRKICLGILHNYDIRPVEIGVWSQPELFSASMVKSIEHSEDEATVAMASAVDELVRRVHEFEGSMEYCHGVGLKQAHLMHAEHGYGLELMKRLKQALDPYGILNPGKLALT